jgi:membrane associated rhomboid family serine protease
MKALSGIAAFVESAPVVISLMSLMVLVSSLAFTNKQLFLKLILHPFSVVHQKQYYRLVSFDLVHNDIIHLGLNIFMMWISCIPLERFLNHKSTAGDLQFLLIYLAAHFSGALYITFRHRKDFEYSVAGASGSIMGCLFSFMLVQPHVIAFYLPVIGGVQNGYTALIYIALLIRLQFKNKSAYSHELHFFGGLGGALATVLLFPNLLHVAL